MPADFPKTGGEKKSDDFDVVLVHGETGDGEGARVLRARPGRLEAGEMRPVREGRALTPGGEVVHLAQRPEAPFAYDVESSFQIPGKPEEQERSAGGPAQVATPAYRDSWERTFGARKRRELAN